jgi:hypothetical protein
MNTPTQPTPARTKRRYEEDGVFYVGSVKNDGARPVRLLCFRSALTGAVGASRRFSREEAWRKSRRRALKALVSREPAA